MLLRSQYLQAGLPLKYHHARVSGMTGHPQDPPAYATSLDLLRRYVGKVKEAVQSGFGLFLWTNPSPLNPRGTGTGKTSAACAIANEFILATCYEAMLEPQVVFINTAELLHDMRRGFDDKEIREQTEGTLRLLREVPLAIYDDFGAEKPSDWVREQLYVSINYRVQNGMAVIATSNYSIDYLANEDRLGYRVASRIEEACTPLDMTGIDRRKGGSW